MRVTTGRTRHGDSRLIVDGGSLQETERKETKSGRKRFNKGVLAGIRLAEIDAIPDREQMLVEGLATVYL